MNDDWRRTDDVGDHFQTPLSRELFHLVCGTYLGGGRGRDVYVYRLDARFVLKIENAAGSFQNVIEWETWDYAKEDHEARKWLAPCHEISQCGRILIQERADTNLAESAFPQKVPVWITDLKRANWGRIGKRLVCIDYGKMGCLLDFNRKLKRAEWWA